MTNLAPLAYDVGTGDLLYNDGSGFVTIPYTGPMGPAGPTGATGAGVVTGGTTGQILKKNSATNYDCSWGAGGGVWVNLDDYGAAGDGTTDDSTALQNAINAAGQQGTVYIPAKRYYINADITNPFGVKLIGSGGVGGNTYYDNTWFIGLKSCFLLNPSHTIKPSYAFEMENITIINSAITSIPLNGASSFSGTAFTIGDGTLNYVDVTLRNVLILGFNKAVYAVKAPRLHLYDVHFDCVNGIEVAGAGDPVHLIRPHGWPYLSAAWGTNAALVRNGVAYRFTGNQDATKVVGAYAVDYYQTFYTTDSNGISFQQCGSDAPDVSGSIGFKHDGSFGFIQQSNCQYVGTTTGLLVSSSSATGQVIVSGGYFGTNTGNDIVVSEGSLSVGGNTVFNSAVSDSISTATTTGIILIGEVDIRENKTTGSFFLNNGPTPNYHVSDLCRVQNTAVSIMNAPSWPIPVLASAATLRLPGYGNVFYVSGTTTIGTVANLYPGRQVTLIFQGILTVTDSAGLNLAGNFVTTANDTLTLMGLSQVTAIEVSRSVN